MTDPLRTLEAWLTYDEIAIWGRALTAAEIGALHNAGNGLSYSAAVALVEGPLNIGFWTFGTRDIAVAFADENLENANTNTTFRNVSGGTLDITCIVEMGE